MKERFLLMKPWIRDCGVQVYNNYTTLPGAQTSRNVRTKVITGTVTIKQRCFLVTGFLPDNVYGVITWTYTLPGRAVIMWHLLYYRLANNHQCFQANKPNGVIFYWKKHRASSCHVPGSSCCGLQDLYCPNLLCHMTPSDTRYTLRVNDLKLFIS